MASGVMPDLDVVGLNCAYSAFMKETKSSTPSYIVQHCSGAGPDLLPGRVGVQKNQLGKKARKAQHSADRLRASPNKAASEPNSRSRAKGERTPNLIWITSETLLVM